MLEAGEACDCAGNMTACGCCDGATCKAATGGRECRSSTDDCDLAEFCDGRTSSCPPDTHKRNGETCVANNVVSTCYNGRCVNAKVTCDRLWGPGLANGDDEVYALNLSGFNAGNCGTLYENNAYAYLPCAQNDVRCGLAHCCQAKWVPEAIPLQPTSDMLGFTYYYYANLSCYSAWYNVGIDTGMTPDGTVCGEGRSCVDRKCLETKIILNKTACSQCKSNWVCNNIGICQCNNGYRNEECWSFDAAKATYSNILMTSTNSYVTSFKVSTSSMTTSSIISVTSSTDSNVSMTRTDNPETSSAAIARNAVTSSAATASNAVTSSAAIASNAVTSSAATASNAVTSSAATASNAQQITSDYRSRVTSDVVVPTAAVTVSRNTIQSTLTAYASTISKVTAIISTSTISYTDVETATATNVSRAGAVTSATHVRTHSSSSSSNIGTAKATIENLSSVATRVPFNSTSPHFQTTQTVPTEEESVKLFGAIFGAVVASTLILTVIIRTCLFL